MPMMKVYESFDAYERDQTPKNRAIIRALRRFVRAAAPQLTETVKWGNGCWVAGAIPIAYAHAQAELVQFGFFNGAALKDPHELLEGTGRYVRHIKVRTAAAVDPSAFGALLKQAAQRGHPGGRAGGTGKKRSTAKASSRGGRGRPVHPHSVRRHAP